MSVMDSSTQPKHHLPTIGMRNIKTAIAATLCALVY